MEFFLTIMLNYEALPGKRYYIQYPSLEFCQAGRRKVLEEQRSTIERVGRIGGLRSIAAVCTSGKRPTRETETERELDSAIKRSEEHTSELQSLRHLVCRLLLEKKKKKKINKKRLTKQTKYNNK